MSAQQQGSAHQQNAPTSPRSIHVVELGHFVVARGDEAVLQTPVLGSAVALAVCAPELGLAGLLHFLMPDAKAQQQPLQCRPELFADSGIELLLGRLHGLGADKAQLVAYIAGGGDLIYHRNLGRPIALGQRNVDAAHRVLSDQRITIARERVGGCRARMITVAPATGAVHIAETPTGGET